MMGLEDIYPDTFKGTIEITRMKSPLPELFNTTYSGYLLCLDPGETTGYALFRNFQLINSGQVITKNRSMAYDHLGTMSRFMPKASTSPFEFRVVMEDYRMYGWKKDEHTFSKLHTPKLIGAFEAILGMKNIPYTMQMAVTAKSFATDELLRHWGYWQKGERHARDAIRHGLYYLMFNKNTFDIDAPTLEEEKKRIT